MNLLYLFLENILRAMYLNLYLYSIARVCICERENKNKQGHILYSQNRVFVYTIHKTTLRETLSVVQLRTSAFPFTIPFQC